MNQIDCPSPNFDDRGRGIDTVILHYTGMKTGEEALERLCDADAKVSAHYLIEENGDVYTLVPEDKRAWHAGVSSWRGETDINARSIGIEIVNPGHEWGYKEFPDEQIAAVIRLLKDILQRRAIEAKRVLAHSDVAPSRKDDPGEKFPWGRLASEGLALAPFNGPPDANAPYAAAIEGLKKIGYEVSELAPGKPAPAASALAFQRRFCPQALGQGLDPLTRAAIIAVAKASGS